MTCPIITISQTAKLTFQDVKRLIRGHTEPEVQVFLLQTEQSLRILHTQFSHKTGANKLSEVTTASLQRCAWGWMTKPKKAERLPERSHFPPEDTVQDLQHICFVYFIIFILILHSYLLRSGSWKWPGHFYPRSTPRHMDHSPLPWQWVL